MEQLIPQTNGDAVIQMFSAIAASIKPALIKNPAYKGSEPEPEEQPAGLKNDKNFIFHGTELYKYIGSSEDIDVPKGVTSVANSICSGKTQITSVRFPEGVTSIGSRAFENCFSLQAAILPESLEDLGNYMFCDCHELRYAELGHTKITVVESSVFSECFKLENIVLPPTLKYIDAFAFKNCRSLTRMVIPEGVTGIGIL